MTLKFFKSAVPVLALVLMAGAAGCQHEQSVPQASSL